MTETLAVPGAAELIRAAASHLVPGITDLHRLLGAGGTEESAEGAEVRLSNGRTLLDFGSYAVTLFGHRPPEVVDAVHRALDTMPTSTRLVANPVTAALASRLAGLVAPERLRRIWLGLTGSDVVEAVLKLSIAATGTTSVLAAQGAFHGKSMGALALTADGERRTPFAGFLGDVRHLPLEPDAVRRAAQERPFAALIVEPVQGEGGGRPLPPALLRQWAEDARRVGAFVIADEIQCGLRRCGPVSVSESVGMDADAVLFGKPLGGGVLPLSAALCSERLYAPLLADPFLHTSTFSGHPASCAAGLAALDLLDAHLDDFARVGRRLAEGVALLAAQHPGVVAEGRTLGLFGALELADRSCSSLALMEAGRRGLLLAPCLSEPTVLRILPPVVVTDEQLDRAMGILDTVLASVARRTAAR
ncbi:aminotransferase class III-fold pyridoxal phosphate-dependent enzyme [Streptacidiphilus rugosus]|uniref:aminotransferase class III-fold pyridoxal phosphate-dependent enzyme n=1 Tax=Streptacidiphilus rugosus TaxID=405783 RepID=UPI00055CF032|nr:aminotransferase class III-fold pyridoxal phosphate-dependent enzyme [Streptacidiphilus rugosus]